MGALLHGRPWGGKPLGWAELPCMTKMAWASLHECPPGRTMSRSILPHTSPAPDHSHRAGCLLQATYDQGDTGKGMMLQAISQAPSGTVHIASHELSPQGHGSCPVGRSMGCMATYDQDDTGRGHTLCPPGTGCRPAWGGGPAGGGFSKLPPDPSGLAGLGGPHGLSRAPRSSDAPTQGSGNTASKVCAYQRTMQRRKRRDLGSRIRGQGSEMKDLGY